MTDHYRRHLVLVAGSLVLVSGAIHLVLGVFGVVDPGLLGVHSVIVPFLFIGASLVMIGGVTAVTMDRLNPRIAYGSGAVLMVVFVLAYLDWHVFQTITPMVPVEILSGEPGHSHTHGSHHHHDTTVVQSTVDHLRADHFALIAKTAETIAAFTLSYLAFTEPT